MEKNSVLIAGSLIVLMIYIYNRKKSKTIIMEKDKDEDINTNTDNNLEQQPINTSGNPDTDVKLPEPNAPSNSFPLYKSAIAVNLAALGVIGGYKIVDGVIKKTNLAPRM